MQEEDLRSHFKLGAFLCISSSNVPVTSISQGMDGRHFSLTQGVRWSYLLSLFLPPSSLPKTGGCSGCFAISIYSGDCLDVHGGLVPSRNRFTRPNSQGQMDCCPCHDPSVSLVRLVNCGWLKLWGSWSTLWIPAGVPSVGRLLSEAPVTPFRLMPLPPQGGLGWGYPQVSSCPGCSQIRLPVPRVGVAHTPSGPG